jgi:16S rRNA (guanine966-N2)-methyltransferase
MGHEQSVLSVLANMRYVTDETLIIVEAALKSDFDWADALGFEVLKEKKYKTNKHVYLRRV